MEWGKTGGIHKGVSVELEHGTKYPETNVTNNDKELTGKIAWAHLKEFPDYYTRLKKLEKKAMEYWKKKGRSWSIAKDGHLDHIWSDRLGLI